MTTPDTEWEKWCDTLAGYSGSASNENFKAHKEATLALITSRDTYWKDREALNSEREYLRGFREGQELERKVTKADWLRSEIEKLGSEIAIHTQLASEWTGIDIKNNILHRINPHEEQVNAFTSIITRYKEELKVLTGE